MKLIKTARNGQCGSFYARQGGLRTAGVKEWKNVSEDVDQWDVAKAIGWIRQCTCRYPLHIHSTSTSHPLHIHSISPCERSSGSRETIGTKMRVLDPQPQIAKPCSSGCCPDSAPTPRELGHGLSEVEVQASPVEQCSSGCRQDTVGPTEGQRQNDSQTVKGEGGTQSRFSIALTWRAECPDKCCSSEKGLASSSEGNRGCCGDSGEMDANRPGVAANHDYYSISGCCEGKEKRCCDGMSIQTAV